MYEEKGGISIALTPDTPHQHQRNNPAQSSVESQSQPCTRRQSMQRLRRVKSRARQKAQNARAGIRVVTDMTQLQRPVPHHAQGKFVDSAALRALEGEPSSASIGSFSWMRRKTSRNQILKPSLRYTKTNIGADLSPNPGPIVIGISLPSEQVSDASPQTATLETPIDIGKYLPSVNGGNSSKQNNGRPNETPLKSVWSPDTPSTAYSSERSSSIYSQATNFAPLRVSGNIPPVPIVPENFRMERQGSIDQGKSPDSTIYTPFEEDSLSPHSAATSTKSPFGKGYTYRSGWWDHLTSPFAPSPQSTVNEPHSVFYPFVGMTMSTSPTNQHEQRPMKKAVSSIMTKNWVTPQSERWSAAENKKRPVPAPLSTPAYIVPLVPSIHTVAPFTSERGHQNLNTPSTATRLSITAISATNTLIVSPSSSRSASPSIVAPGARPLSPVRSSSSSLMANNPFMQSNTGSQQPTGSQSEKTNIPVAETVANEVPPEQPPPYSLCPPLRQISTVKYAATAPSHLRVNTQPLPSPGVVSPSMMGTMTSQGAINLEEVVLTPPPSGMAGTTIHGEDVNLPRRPPGAMPVAHMEDAPGVENKVERQRRRHEKEDVLVRRIGGYWRGRGCMPEEGCFGRSGREGRKKRRLICLLLLGIVLLIISLAIALPILLLHENSVEKQALPSIWLNLTDFPPMPTGVLTVTGAEKRVEVNTCVNPPTMWSCYLPKEDAEINDPFARDQPTLIFQVQFDNSGDQQWKIPQGVPPTSLPGDAEVDAGDGIGETIDKANKTANSTRRKSRFFSRALFRGSIVQRRVNSNEGDSQLFHPSPSPPSFQEMWFLGNTTDGVISDNKAGEPTPFYITILSSLSESAGVNALSKRQTAGLPSLGDITDELDKQKNETLTDEDANGDESGLETGVKVNLTGLLPPPSLNANGTGAKAVSMPTPAQQPVRLYDRGLPSEHYGFYAYFDKTIYLRSTKPASNDSDIVTEDLDGGSVESQARKLVTFSETRFFVRIWTQQSNATRLVNTENLPENGVPQADGRIVLSENSTSLAPGTFPYPVTFGLDTHGGNRTRKTAWLYNVNEGEMTINPADPLLILNNIGVAGSWINPRASGDPALGGFDGGTGGCRCLWQNFDRLN